MVQVPNRSYRLRESELDATPPIGPNPAIRRVFGRDEDRELRWWVAVLVGAVLLSLLALYAVH